MLGGAGLWGAAAQGRSGEGVEVNAVTGNLVLQKQDEFLVGLGPDASVSRTYNSLTTLTDDNNDKWRQSTDRRVYGQNGPLNDVGGTVKRVSGDGTEIVYGWDAQKSAYVATDGAGAYDTVVLSMDHSEWIWTDGDTQTVERYANDVTGYISSSTDRNGSVLTFSYDPMTHLLAQQTTQDKNNGQTQEWIRYQWVDTSTKVNKTNRTDRVQTGYTNLVTLADTTITRTRYGYDEDTARLTTVTADLSPGDNSIADAKTYVTTYSYNTAGRVSNIAQSDGSSLAINFDPSNRVSYLTQTVSSGVIRKTQLADLIDADTGKPYTNVTDAANQVTRLDYDANGNLTKITAPAAYAGAAQQMTQFSYNSNGDVTSTTDALGNTTSYSGFVNGLATTIVDRLGNTTTRSYGTTNLLLSEVVSGVDATGAAVAEKTRYVYNAAGDLRFAISPQGRVTQYALNSAGYVTAMTDYPETSYTTAGTPSETDMTNWVGGLSDQSWVKQTKYGYDARGSLVDVAHYGIALKSGDGQANDNGYDVTNYTYDQAGKLHSTTSGANLATTYAYDGMGRVFSTSDTNGGTTTIAFNDSATTTTLTLASGYVTTKTYNKAGDLLSVTDSGANTNGGTTAYSYDALGRVRVQTDAIGLKTYTLYDAAGRHVGDVDNDGDLTEYVYDADNRLIGTLNYHTVVSAATLTNLSDPNYAVVIASLRPAASAQDTKSWSIYDAEGRIVETIAGDGSVTTATYDAGGHLQQTKAYKNKIAQAIVDGFITNPPVAANRVVNSLIDGTYGWASNFDPSNICTYLPIAETTSGVPDLKMGFTATAANQSLSMGTTTFAAIAGERLAISVGVGGQGPITNLKLTIAYFNAAGTKFTSNVAIGQLSGPQSFNTPITGFVTVPAGAVAASLELYIATSGTGAGYATIAQAMVSQAAVSQTTLPPYMFGLGSAADQVSRSFYDADGLLLGALDGQGYLTANTYDQAGQLTATTAYATATTSTLRALGSFNALLASVGTSSQDRTSHFVYDGRGVLRYSVDALNQVVRYDYDQANNKTTTTVYAAPMAATSDYTYDNVKSLTAALDSNAANRRSYMVYDAAGRLAYQVDATRTVTSYAYDNRGQITRTVAFAVAYTSNVTPKILQLNTWVSNNIGNPANRITRTWYTERGEAAYVVDAEGYVTKHDYDAKGQLKTLTAWPNRVAVNDTTTLAQVAAAVSGTPITRKWDYDSLGRTVRAYDGNAITTTYAYHGATSLVNAVKQAANGTAVEQATTGTVYDAAGHAIQVTYANGVLATRSFDGLGELTSSTSAVASSVAQTTTYAYDLDGRLTLVTDAAGGVTVYAYNAFDQVWKTTDPNGNISYKWYDTLGRVTTERDAGNYLTTTTYTVFGEVAAVQRWVTSVTSTASSSTPSVPVNGDTAATTSFTYDADGRVTSTTDANGNGGVTAYAWDGTLATTGIGTFGGWVDTTTYANAMTAISKQDIYDRETYRKDLGSHMFNATFDAAGRELTGNGNSYTWYNTGLIATTTTASAQGKFGYDKAGNRTSEQQFAADGTNQSVNETTAYDTLGRMTQFNETGVGNTPAASTSWQYDANGNIRRATSTHKTLDNNGNASANPVTDDYWFRFDSMNRLVTDKGMLSGAAGDSGTKIVRTVVNNPARAGHDYSYDKAGNRATEAVTRYNTDGSTFGDREIYQIDGAGRIASIAATYDSTGGTIRSQFTYDKLGRQLQQADFDKYGTTHIYDHTASYMANGDLANDNATTLQSGSNDTYSTASTYKLKDSSGTYLLGAVDSVVTTNSKNGSVQSTRTTVNTYRWWDGAQQNVITYTPDISKSTINSTTLGYDGQGTLLTASINDGRRRTVTFVSNADGQVIRRDEADGINVGGISNPFLTNVANGVVRSAITQGIGVATGLQSKFDFVGIAAAGIGAGIGGAVARGLDLQSLTARGGQSFANIAGNTLASTASALANAATRSIANGSDFGDNVIAALPDVIANTIGNLVADGIASMDRNGHAAELLKEIAPDGATAEQRQYVKEMLKVGVSDTDILNLYAQGLGVGLGPVLASSGSTTKLGVDSAFGFAEAKGRLAAAAPGFKYDQDIYPPELTRLMAAHPEINKLADWAWNSSLNPVNDIPFIPSFIDGSLSGSEHGFLYFENAKGKSYSIKLFPDLDKNSPGYGFIKMPDGLQDPNTGLIRAQPGYHLAVAMHVHPFTTDPAILGGDGGVIGPSRNDFNSLYANPTAVGWIRSRATPTITQNYFFGNPVYSRSGQ